MSVQTRTSKTPDDARMSGNSGVNNYGNTVTSDSGGGLWEGHTDILGWPSSPRSGNGGPDDSHSADGF